MSVVGLDIGSQSSFCGVARQGGIEVVANEYSKRATETVVSLGDKMRHLGTAGNEKRISQIKSTCLNFKRLVGLPFEHPIVQAAACGPYSAPYKIIKCATTGTAAVQLPTGQVYSVQQVMAMFLGKMKEIAETNLSRMVDDCVITCPVFYSEDQRRALQDAAVIAGLKPLQIMSETTAAALAYGIYKQDLPDEGAASRNVVFVDFGFNSLQVTTASFNKGKLSILGSAWDETLGGSSFDNVIYEKLAADFLAKYKCDASTNKRAQVKLIEACEKAKKTMSANSIDIPINLECWMNDKDVTGKVNRTDFEELAAPLLARIKATLERGLVESGLKKEDLYAVEIVGGATRMPCFKEAVKAVFGLESCTTLNTDEASARGAALKCAILSPTFRVREFNIVDSVQNEITINWAADSTGANGGALKIFEKKGQFPFTKAMTIYRKTNDDFELSADFTGGAAPVALCKYSIGGLNPVTETEEKGKKVKLYFRMDGSGLFSLSACEQIEKFEEWVEVPVEKKPETEKAADGAKGEPMETDTSGKEANSGDKMETEEKKDEGDAPAQPEMRKEKKIKQRKSPLKMACLTQLGATPIDVLNKFLEVECHLKATDKEEKDKSDSKNELEEAVYMLRDKLYSAFENYVTETEKSNLSKTCDEIEDWLYGDGEDLPKNAYVERKSNLDAVIAPIKHRLTEFEGRKPAFESLTTVLNVYQKIVGECEAKLPDSKYAHLEADDVRKMSEAVQEGWKFFSEAQMKVKDLKANEDPTVTCYDINAKRSYIDNLCKPISQKKAPKVEPPKEEAKPDANTEATKTETPMEEGSQNPSNTTNPDDLD